MKIRRATEEDCERWDAFVKGHQDATPYHLFHWTGAVKSAYGFDSVRILSEESGVVSGILAMTIFRIPLRKTSLVALPYCDVGATLAANPETENSLVQYAISQAELNDYASLELRGAINEEVVENIDYPVIRNVSKVRMLMELPSSSTELWDGFKSKLRSQVRKAEKNGLRCDLTNNRITDFYDVFSKNMRDLGSPVHSKRWITEIVSAYGDNATIGLVYHEEKPIGAGLILRAGNNIAIPWASTLREYNRLNPNMLLYWTLLKCSSDQGAKQFDFGRSTKDEGTFRFKSQWGAVPEPLIWYSIDLSGKSAVQKRESGKGRNVIAEAWSRLPLGLANVLGPKLRKYISL